MSKLSELSPGKRALLIGCGVIVLLGGLFISVAGGLVLYSIKSGKDIPLVSKVADSVQDSTYDPEDEFKTNKEEITSGMLDILDQMVTDDGLSQEEFLNTDWEKMFGSEELDQENMPSKVEFDVNVIVSESGDDSSVGVTGDALLDFDTSDVKVDLTATYDEAPVSVSGDINFVYDAGEKTAYVKIDDAFASEIGIDPDQWLYLDIAELEEYIGDAMNVGTDYDTSDNVTIEQDEYDDLKKLLESDSYMPKIEIVDSRDYDDGRGRCVLYTWDDEVFDDIKEFVNDEFETMDESHKEDFYEMLDSIDKITYLQCADRNSDKVYEVEFEIKISESETDVSVKVNVKSSAFGESQNIEIPEGDVDIFEMIDDYLNPPIIYDYDDYDLENYSY